MSSPSAVPHPSPPCRRRRTRRPRRKSRRSHPSRSEANPPPINSAYRVPNASSSRARTSTRRNALPAQIRRDVAAPRRSGGKSSSSTFTLSPTPITTWRTPSGSEAISARIPAAFRPPQYRSFGHLRAAGTPTASTASARATPATRASRGASTVGTEGRRSRETYRFFPAGDTHRRPIRPRPAVCASATTTVPCFAPFSAISIATRFVLSVTARHTRSVHGRPGRSASRTSSTVSIADLRRSLSPGGCRRRSASRRRSHRASRRRERRKGSDP